MSVGEVEATETNPFRSRAVIPKHKESDTAVREVALPSVRPICFLHILGALMFRR